MVAPGIRDAVAELGFQRDYWDFLFLALTLRDDISPDEIDPSRWYASAND